MSHTASIEFNPTSIASEETLGLGDKILVRPISDVTSTSIFLDSQVPEFVLSDHPKFLQFMKAYYDWMNLPGNAGYQSYKIKNEQDIDYATEEYAEMLHREYLNPIPRNLKASRNQILKYAKHFYRSKGTEKSFKLFFRMLFDTNVEFYYPRVDVLKPSDGRWINEKSIRVVLIPNESSDFENKKIVGKTSGCSAIVDRVNIINTEQVSAKELFLNVASMTGSFLPDELIQTEDGSVARVSPVISKIQFTKNFSTNKENVGESYAVGDEFDVSFLSGHQGKIRVASVTDTGAIRRFSVVNFGLEYREKFTTRIDSSTAHTPVKFSIHAPQSQLTYNIYGKTIVASILGIVNEIDLEYYLGFLAPGAICKLTGTDGSGSPVSLNCRIDNSYRNRYAPSVDKVLFSIQLYLTAKTDRVLPATITLQSIESTTGLGAEVEILPGTLCEYPGYYISNNGQLSESKYIQDSHFYQQFSYVLYSNECTDSYRILLNSLLHPIGLKFFGAFRDPTTTSARIKTPRGSWFKREFTHFSRPDLIPFTETATLPGQGRSQGTHRPRQEDVQKFPVKQRLSARTSFVIKHDMSKDIISATLGPSNSSVYRDRFQYLPTESGPNIFELNQQQPGTPCKFTSVPNSLPSAQLPQSWASNFDDSETLVAYNTYRADTSGTTNTDNKKYWGESATRILQYANLQICHFKDVIPKSLEMADVPDVVIFRGNTELKDNLDYRVVGKSFRGYYVIRLLQGSTSGQFSVAFKDKNGMLSIKQLDAPNAKNEMEIKYRVGLKGPNSRINILPESVVTKGV